MARQEDDRRTVPTRRPSGSCGGRGAGARRLRREAEEYVDAKLAQFEIALRKILEESQSTSARARQDARPGRGRVATSSARRRPPPSRSSATRGSPDRARPSCSTRRRSDDLEPIDVRDLLGPPGELPTRATSTGPLDGPRHRAGAACATTSPSRATCCWSAWSRASWSRAHLRRHARAAVRPVPEGLRAARSRSRCTSCSSPAPERRRRRLPARPRGLARPRADGPRRARARAAVLAACTAPTARACAASAAATATWASARATTPRSIRAGPGSSSCSRSSMDRN